MKVNQPAVNPQASLSSREVAEKARAAEESNNEAIAAAEKEEDGVTLTVSQRNVVDVSESDAKEAYEPVGGIIYLLEQLTANPEDTAGLHASLTPERVLQLLA